MNRLRPKSRPHWGKAQKKNKRNICDWHRTTPEGKKSSGSKKSVNYRNRLRGGKVSKRRESRKNQPRAPRTAPKFHPRRPAIRHLRIYIFIKFSRMISPRPYPSKSHSRALSRLWNEWIHLRGRFAKCAGGRPVMAGCYEAMILSFGGLFQPGKKLVTRKGMTNGARERRCLWATSFQSRFFINIHKLDGPPTENRKRS